MKIDHVAIYAEDLKGMKLQEVGQKKTSWVQLFRAGKWSHPRYGKLQFTSEIFDGFRWLQIQDSEGRIGWTLEIFIQTPTISPTPILDN